MTKMMNMSLQFVVVVVVIVAAVAAAVVAAAAPARRERNRLVVETSTMETPKIGNTYQFRRLLIQF